MVDRDAEHNTIWRAFQAKDWATIEQHSESALSVDWDWNQHNYLNGVRFIIVARHELNQPFQRCVDALKQGLDVANIPHEECHEVLQYWIPHELASRLAQELLLTQLRQRQQTSARTTISSGGDGDNGAQPPHHDRRIQIITSEAAAKELLYRCEQKTQKNPSSSPSPSAPLATVTASLAVLVIDAVYGRIDAGDYSLAYRLVSSYVSRVVPPNPNQNGDLLLLYLALKYRCDALPNRYGNVEPKNIGLVPIFVFNRSRVKTRTTTLNSTKSKEEELEDPETAGAASYRWNDGTPNSDLSAHTRRSVRDWRLYSDVLSFLTGNELGLRPVVVTDYADRVVCVGNEPQIQPTEDGQMRCIAQLDCYQEDLMTCVAEYEDKLKLYQKQQQRGSRNIHKLDNNSSSGNSSSTTVVAFHMLWRGGGKGDSAMMIPSSISTKRGETNGSHYYHSITSGTADDCKVRPPLSLPPILPVVNGGCAVDTAAASSAYRRRPVLLDEGPMTCEGVPNVNRLLWITHEVHHKYEHELKDCYVPVPSDLRSNLSTSHGIDHPIRSNRLAPLMERKNSSNHYHNHTKNNLADFATLVRTHRSHPCFDRTLWPSDFIKRPRRLVEVLDKTTADPPSGLHHRDLEVVADTSGPMVVDFECFFPSPLWNAEATQYSEVLFYIQSIVMRMNRISSPWPKVSHNFLAAQWMVGWGGLLLDVDGVAAVPMSVNRAVEHNIIWEAFQAKDWATIEKHSESALMECACAWNRHNYLNGVRFIIVARYELSRRQSIDRCLDALMKGLAVAGRGIGIGIPPPHAATGDLISAGEILQHWVPPELARILNERALLISVLHQRREKWQNKKQKKDRTSPDRCVVA